MIPEYFAGSAQEKRKRRVKKAFESNRTFEVNQIFLLQTSDVPVLYPNWVKMECSCCETEVGPLELVG